MSREGDEFFEELAEHDPEYAEEVDAERTRIQCEAHEEEIRRNIEEVREHSEYWADRFTEEQERIKEWSERELQRRIECEKNGEEYLPSSDEGPSSAKLETAIELAKGGITPDAMAEVMDDYAGLQESGAEYFESKEGLLEKLDQISYGEAMGILERGNEEGKYTEDNYRALQSTIRRHYGA